jgi:hypothetical protein
MYNHHRIYFADTNNSQQNTGCADASQDTKTEPSYIPFETGVFELEGQQFVVMYPVYDESR